ncbi:MAG: hydrogenase maturation nickel metallochaperone HypA [Candidatus Omnitrophica bacterium]|nr:hydrogenase nickel incorporation protein HypA [bacterium]NUN95519.1 hydrogenase maturation nickel metallochaperone HypA [Candidatus Omnitrophota bacterium]
MHEFSIVESLVQALLPEVERAGGGKVQSVRFRRGSAFSEDALRQAFEALALGTPLEGATVDVETVNRVFNCPTCRHSQVVTSQDLMDHLFVCPKCGFVEEIEEAHDLELLEVQLLQD